MNVKLMIVASVVAAAQNDAGAPPVNYAREVKPILAARARVATGRSDRRRGFPVVPGTPHSTRGRVTRL